MLRAFFIYLSKASWAKQIVTRWPVAWQAASRFVAGEKLEDGIAVVRKLNQSGIQATLDQLGEHTTSTEGAEKATQGILRMLDAIEAENVRSNVSIKLTQIGLKVDVGLCAENLARILQHARERSNFVRIDMEDSSCVEDTLALFDEMRNGRGFHNVGVVLQSYLYRTVEDLMRLMRIPARVRLCKGAYNEPPHLAYPKKRDVDANYDRLTQILLDRALEVGAPELSEDGRVPPIPALATHDEQRIRFALEYAKQIGLPKKALEFQMLYGIRRDLQTGLVEQGYPVRVYVPFGTEWYPYFTRRLAERPANVWFFISNYFRK
ncbi:MAG: proline dehydrogenase family protein [Anaerolineales bacterium]|nr:proline dehydrogenase family protein [Anaerolineales bacterium]MCS7247797.1 proline dehydrogenase family protein [Anaerolineales bacterium]MDW8161607.1 proline dehydrogenase family protein [Anaerolineales bacterium]MDW8446297.1 proline dehydrogenase family protein [Anaerolineales bacterium]